MKQDGNRVLIASPWIPPIFNDVIFVKKYICFDVGVRGVLCGTNSMLTSDSNTYKQIRSKHIVDSMCVIASLPLAGAKQHSKRCKNGGWVMGFLTFAFRVPYLCPRVMRVKGFIVASCDGRISFYNSWTHM